MFLLTNIFSFLWLRIPKAANFPRSTQKKKIEGLFSKPCSDRPDRRNSHEQLYASAHPILFIVGHLHGRISTVRRARVQTPAAGYGVWKPLRRPRRSSK